MKRFPLFPGSPASSQLGYGTTSLMGAATTSERRCLLNGAYDAGITHFDTAPYYGYGEAERLVGEFLSGKRDQITVTTKYGIQASALVQARWVNLLARRVLRTFPFLRKAIPQNGAALSQKSNFSAPEARASLDRSLNSLKTDYIDLFLLHEPLLEDASSDEMHEILEGEITRGRIRAYGCGGIRDNMESIAAAGLPTGKWLQFEDNVFLPEFEVRSGAAFQSITYGPFGTALRPIVDWISSNSSIAAEWEKKLDANCTDPATLAELLQASSHARNPNGILLFSTHRAERIKSAVNIATNSRFSPGQLSIFQELATTINSSQRPGK
jgi:D-threo-aldose 1-dehydrogenase